MLSDTDFLKLIEIAPLISIDFIIENEKKEVLLGLRKNAPAKGYYFVPGGRIRKNESFESAIRRISFNELGYEIALCDLTPVGVYEQFYDENFFNKENVKTHYVALVYKLNFPFKEPLSKDEQHEKYEFIYSESIQEHPLIHPFCKRYFTSEISKCLSNRI